MSLLTDDYGYVRVGWILGTIVAVVVLLITLGMWLVPNIDAHYEARNCRRYHEATGRVTKFARYTHWGWDCLTDNPSQPGTFIPIEQLRGVR